MAIVLFKRAQMRKFPKRSKEKESKRKEEELRL